MGILRKKGGCYEKAQSTEATNGGACFFGFFCARGAATGALPQDMAWLQSRYAGCSDLVYRQFLVGGRQERQAAIFYFDGMTSSKIVHDNILQPLLLDAELVQYDAKNDQNLKNYVSLVQQRLLPSR